MWNCYAVLVLMQYAISAPFFSTAMFYGLLLPLVVISGWRNRNMVSDSTAKPMIVGFGVLFAFVLLQAAGCGNLHDIKKTAMDTLATATFLFGSTLFFGIQNERKLHRFLAVWAVLAAVCAVASIYAFHVGYPASRYDGTRLSPIGRAGNPILGGLVYGSAGIVALYCARQARSGVKEIGYVGIVSIIGYLIVLTGSRMPLVAYVLCVSLGVLRGHGSRKRLLLSVIAALGAVGLAIYMTPHVQDAIADYFTQCFLRKDGYRFELWRQTMSGIIEHPWLGNGLQTRLLPPSGAPDAYNPHNLYLATAFYLGIPAAVGFAGLILWCVGLGIRLVRTGDPINMLAWLLLLQGLMSGMTDHAQLVKTPSPLWFILWLPVGFVIARASQRFTKTTDNG
jgi:O-antigen ligase